MRVRMLVVAHLIDSTGQGVNVSQRELEELGEELETVIEAVFQNHPWATEEHNQVMLSRVGVKVWGDNDG